MVTLLWYSSFILVSWQCRHQLLLVYRLVQKLIHHCVAYVYHVPPPAACVSAYVVVKIILFQLHIAILYKLVFSFSGVVVLICVLNLILFLNNAKLSVTDTASITFFHVLQAHQVVHEAYYM